MHSFVCTLLGLLAVVPAIGGEPIFPLDEVRAGQRGFGLSVFAGGEPERFQVEVLGVWRQVGPDTSYILARLSGRDLETSGVVAGMSGSPVYLDDRLAGAVAFAWPFSLQAIAGITPIEAMQRLSSVASTGASPTLDEPVALRDLIGGRLPPELLRRRLALLARSPVSGASSGVTWTAFGFGRQTQDLLAGGLGSIAPAGREGTGEASVLTPGAAVAGVLVDGDLQLAATGTVTQRDGERILAFGHPFLGVGPIELPMATATVITVLANQLNSFKLTNLGAVVGSFDLDRMTGVRGELGRQARMTPVQITVDGDRSRDFELRLAGIPLVTPALVAISILGTLEAVTQAAGSQGLDLTARFEIAGRGVLEIEQSFDGDSTGMEAALYLLAVTDYLLNNRLEDVELTGLQVDLSQYPAPRIARLVEAHASKTLVQPGDTVSLYLDLIAYRGERQRRSVDLVLPTGIPDGRYSLLVGDGVTLDLARLSIEQTSPVSFGQALAFLRSLHSRRELVVLGVFGGKGLAVAGEVLPRLPGSVRSLWGAAGSSSAVPLELAIAQQQELPLEYPVEGAVRVDLEVRRKGPLVPEAGSGPPGADEASPAAEDASSSRGEATVAGDSQEGEP